MELWHCDCKHPSKATAQECALHRAEQYAAPPAGHPASDPAADLAAMRESIAATIGLPIEFR
jgi:hypothetical protein